MKKMLLAICLLSLSISSFAKIKIKNIDNLVRAEFSYTLKDLNSLWLINSTYLKLLDTNQYDSEYQSRYQYAIENHWDGDVEQYVKTLMAFTAKDHFDDISTKTNFDFSKVQLSSKIATLTTSYGELFLECQNFSCKLLPSSTIIADTKERTLSNYNNALKEAFLKNQEILFHAEGTRQQVKEFLNALKKLN